MTAGRNLYRSEFMDWKHTPTRTTPCSVRSPPCPPVRRDRPAPARIGRPRLSLGDGDPTEEILAVAVRLFGELGVGDTTMARIATEAGLRQSSLYYYFRSKEEILATLVARANVVPLELIDADRGRTGGSAAVRLYRFVRGDVIALCRLPFDINEVHRIAARDRERFADYWTERRTLRRRIARSCARACSTDHFRQVDPR